MYGDRLSIQVSGTNIQRLKRILKSGPYDPKIQSIEDLCGRLIREALDAREAHVAKLEKAS